MSDRASRYKEVNAIADISYIVGFTMKTSQQFLIFINIIILVIMIYVCIRVEYAQLDCGSERFRCHNGKYIASELLCNGRADCMDASDETEDECKKLKIQCPTSAFRCDYGACINESYICNGIQDCVDNSDETQAQCDRKNRTNNQVKGLTRRCRDDEYRCDNGQCIRNIYKCDGTRNCEDGSDETFRLCTPCLAKTFRCSNGVCIDDDLRCDGVANCSDGSDEDPKLCGNPSTEVTSQIRYTMQPNTNTCTAPPQPRRGHWKLDRSQCLDEDLPEGTELKLGSQLNYFCVSEYTHRTLPDTDIICNSQGKWEPSPPVDACTKKRCRPLDSLRTRAECKYKNVSISCESSVPSGTSAELSCKDNYDTSLPPDIPQGTYAVCNEKGLWKPEPLQCYPACGVTASPIHSVFSGLLADITEFPWHATIYRDKLGEKKFICGATIIQKNLLITAAHCVYDESTRQLYNPIGLYILTGNNFRDYDSRFHNPKFVQKNQVKRIYIDRRYLGLEGNFLWDIAILELVTPFVFSDHIFPACLNTLNTLNDGKVLEDNFLDGRFGKVAGFGKTQFGETSAILLTLTVPVIPISQCLTASQKFKTQRFFTYDKFCAGYTNGSSICDGDSGGGLVFEINALWHLRGIVSVSLGTKEEGGTVSCDNNMYTLYTDVSKHISWIQKVIKQIKYNRVHILCSETSTTRCS